MVDKVKALVSIGVVDLDEAEFVVFNHYTMDEFCDIGAMSVSLACTYLDDYYEVSGTFVVGSEELVTIEVTDISLVVKDEDGDFVNEDNYSICGTSLTVPYSCILAVMTSVCDTEKYDSDIEAFEALMK